MKKELSNLTEFNGLMLYYSSALKKLEIELNIIHQEFNVLNCLNPINHIKTRIKSMPSIIDKLNRKSMDISIENIFKLSDIVGARIVCNFIDDVYEVLKILKSKDCINIIEEKDYIKNPKESGYRGYHIIISIPVIINSKKKNIKAEIQIRTTAMDFWASSEHRLNYKSLSTSVRDRKKLKKVSEEIWIIDERMNELFKKQKSLIIEEKDNTELNFLNNFLNKKIKNDLC